MTALTEYDRLESVGIWRAAPEAQRRDVVISLGDATLVITDLKDMALAHWSLPAVERTNAGELPAIYKPGSDSGEVLEVADATMIEAIERVRTTIARRRPRPGRLRLGIVLVALALFMGVGVFWLPDALVRRTAAIVPDVTRRAIGDTLMTHIERVAGKPCLTETGGEALAKLGRRLLGSADQQIIVMRGGVTEAAHLTGGAILINRALVEDYETPEVVAGYVLAETARAQQHDPLVRLLETTGLTTALRLLTTGEVRRDTLSRYAETIVGNPPEPIADSVLLSRFKDAQVRPAPYGYARDISGETTLGLIESDQVGIADARPILSDGEWVALQGICGE